MIGEPEAPTMTPLLSQMEEKSVDGVAGYLDVWTSERIAFYKVG
jgi:hypothetical protein